MVGHEERVDVGAVAAVVASSDTLALEAELLIEADRGLVPREHVQLELSDTRLACPVDRRLEQGAADPLASLGGGDVDVFDTTDPVSQTEVLAVRLAMVARSGQFEKEEVSPATLTLWPGGTVADGGALELDADARHYRYKVYQTTVPLRNVIWKI